ncbi:MAG: 16S rRNA (cytidine(1402)-2'-O)-methyltransferase [Collinsella phocaeensis]
MEPQEGRLFVVGTPIGNLDDLSPRAAAAFEVADAVCCEDTRVTSKLLAHLGLSRSLVRCDENVIAARAPQLVDRMLAGEVLAYASDAGMPGVSDPGQVLVDAARSAGVPVEVIPGPTACITALVATGISCEHFFFEGFLPRKHGERVRRLRRLAAIPGALLFYESPHRAEDSLAAIAEVFPERDAALCRELTKLHEEVLCASSPELLQMVRERGEMRGEMVLVVAPPSEAELERHEAALAAGGAANADVNPDDLLAADIAEALAAGESANAIAKRLSQKYSRKKRDVYALVLEAQGASA